MDPQFAFIHAPVPLSYADPFHPALATFPTPSELMADLQPAPPHIHIPIPNDLPADDPRPPRRRAPMSATHGSTFVPTDPDSISSHEKKRHYLECIEQYIQFLHEQFELLGEQPPDMDRVASYRGLSSRSIRTLLVHMEHNTRKLTERTRDEEQRFIAVRNALQ